MSIKRDQRQRSISQKFYDQFDYLPPDLKALIWDSPTMPITEDLEVVVKLAEETGSIDKVINRANSKPTQDKETAQQRRERKMQERLNKIGQRCAYITRPVYGRPRLRDDKHRSLILRLLTPEELEKMLATRQENANIQPAFVRPIIGYETVKKVPKERGDKVLPDKPAPQPSLMKLMHNAGGRNS